MNISVATEAALFPTLTANRTSVPRWEDESESTATENDYDSNDGFIYFLENYSYFYCFVPYFLCLPVIILGALDNIVSMVVFTRRNMTSSINTIFTALAFADTMVLLSHLFKIPQFSPLYDQSFFERSYLMAILQLTMIHFFKVNHAASIWLTVVVALWRVVFVSFPTSAAALGSLVRAKVAILSTYVACILLFVPRYLSVIVAESTDRDATYVITYSHLFEDNQGLLSEIIRWIFLVFERVVPCCLLLGLTVVVVRSMIKTKKKRRELNLRSSVSGVTDRTAKVLVAVLVLFLVTNLPETVLIAVDMVLRNRAFETVGTVHMFFILTCQLLGLINSSGNFFVYVTLSSQFRETFVSVFLNPIKKFFVYFFSAEFRHSLASFFVNLRKRNNHDG